MFTRSMTNIDTNNDILVVSRLITRGPLIQVKYDSSSIIWDLQAVHRGLKPLIPYLLGYSLLEGRDSMVLNLTGSKFILMLNKERYSNQLDLDEIAIAKNGKYNIGRYHREYSNLNEILINLVAYELYSICKSAYLEKSYKEIFKNNKVEKILSPHHKIEEGREYNLNLGPNYCSNICLPNYRKFTKYIKINNDSIDMTCMLPEKFARKTSLNGLLKYLHINKINNFGIVHINEFGDIAIGETWYKPEGSFGSSTAGGFNSTPYHPRYGIAVESFEEFNFKILNLNKVKIIRSHLHYCTGLIFIDNFTGKFKVTKNEFKKGSERWISFKQIRSEGTELRNVPFALQDYFKFAEKRIFNKFEGRHNKIKSDRKSQSLKV